MLDLVEWKHFQHTQENNADPPISKVAKNRVQQFFQITQQKIGMYSKWRHTNMSRVGDINYIKCHK